MGLEKLAGESHEKTLQVKFNHSRMLYLMGETEQGEEGMKELVRRLSLKLGENHNEVAKIRQAWANLLLDIGDLEGLDRMMNGEEVATATGGLI